MRKRFISEDLRHPTPAARGWLDLEHVARVELTSEHPDHPIEAALRPNAAGGWRAQLPGPQTIRFLFDQPQRLSGIQLLFEERDRSRTQEFVLRWSPSGGHGYREIVRQQYNLGPGSPEESEEYTVDLDGVTVLELSIVPDISGDGYASLSELRVR